MEQGIKVVIVGGGFGGIRAALDLEKKVGDRAKIVLISDKPHFEYTPSLYRVVTGRSPLEVCVPLAEIFRGKRVEVIMDMVEAVSLKEQKVYGKSGSKYAYDYLVLALGSDTNYFNIPGLQESAFGFRSITEALRLKRHFHEAFSRCEVLSKEDKVCHTHIVVVGAGASGCELAGELSGYAQRLAKKHGIDPSYVTVDLIEAAPRILPSLPRGVSMGVEKRLRSLRVNIFTNKSVVKEDLEQVYLKDMTIKTQTLIWAAGALVNALYGKIEGLFLDDRKRVVVDEFLRSEGVENVFVVGDGAATPYAGFAQTAIRDGRFVARNIVRAMQRRRMDPYKGAQPYYAVPIGAGWAAVVLHSVVLYGRIGWWLRCLADLRFFLSILPLRRAITAFVENKTLCESCVICVPE